MDSTEATLGTRVRTLVDFSGVPMGTEGVIDEDYGTGVMVAWDRPGNPLPVGYKRYNWDEGVVFMILRDGFDKLRDLRFLELVNTGAA